MNDYERDNIRRLAAYQPGEQPPPGPDQPVKLNTNENPYPPPPEVLEAIRGVDSESLRRYPPPTAASCRAAAAAAHGLSVDQVIFTNGGDELLRLAITVFCQTGASGGATSGGVGIAEPSYSLYPVLACIHDTPMTRVPLGDDFALPDDFADRLNEAQCRLAMIVNPHAPSGRLESLERLRSIASQFNGVLLVDEAYVDFASQDGVALLRDFQPLDNVLLLRSLSKGYSLAGLRCGYGLGDRHLIESLDKARDSYNTDILCQVAAEAALNCRDKASKTWQAVIQERQRLSRELSDRGFDVYPSETNFLLVRPVYDARSVYHTLKAAGILVRYFDQAGLDDKLRVTVGTADENNRLLEALSNM